MSISGQETKYVNNSDATNQDLGERYVSKKYVADNYGNILPDRLKGGLWVWGRGGPAFGDGSIDGSTSPKYSTISDDWLSFASGDTSAAAIKREGSLWTWGSNFSGVLGLGDSIDRSSPTQVGSDYNWRSVSITNVLVAIKTDGSLWACGFNQNGQLGLGDTTTRSTLTQVGSSTDWSSVVGGGPATLAIKINGTLWAWGNNEDGQLGLGDIVHRSTPVQVGALTTWKTISLQPSFASIVLKTDGTLWAWGFNRDGMLGLGDTIHRSSPVQIGSDSDWKAASNRLQLLAIKNNGTLWVCGSSGTFVLGLGDLINRSTLVQLGAETNWKFVHAASSSSAAIKSNGTLWTWGSNGNSRLGISPFQGSVSTPVQITPYNTWRYVYTGFTNSVGFRVGGFF